MALSVELVEAKAKIREKETLSGCVFPSLTRAYLWIFHGNEYHHLESGLKGKLAIEETALLLIQDRPYFLNQSDSTEWRLNELQLRDNEHVKVEWIFKISQKKAQLEYSLIMSVGDPEDKLPETETWSVSFSTPSELPSTGVLNIGEKLTVSMGNLGADGQFNPVFVELLTPTQLQNHGVALVNEFQEVAQKNNAKSNRWLVKS